MGDPSQERLRKYVPEYLEELFVDISNSYYSAFFWLSFVKAIP